MSDETMIVEEQPLSEEALKDLTDNKGDDEDEE